MDVEQGTPRPSYTQEESLRAKRSAQVGPDVEDLYLRRGSSPRHARPGLNIRRCDSLRATCPDDCRCSEEEMRSGQCRCALASTSSSASGSRSPSRSPARDGGSAEGVAAPESDNQGSVKLAWDPSARRATRTGSGHNATTLGEHTPRASPSARRDLQRDPVTLPTFVRTPTSPSQNSNRSTTSDGKTYSAASLRTLRRTMAVYGANASTSPRSPAQASRRLSVGTTPRRVRWAQTDESDEGAQGERVRAVQPIRGDSDADEEEEREAQPHFFNGKSALRRPYSDDTATASPRRAYTRPDAPASDPIVPTGRTSSEMLVSPPASRDAGSSTGTPAAVRRSIADVFERMLMEENRNRAQAKAEKADRERERQRGAEKAEKAEKDERRRDPTSADLSRFERLSQRASGSASSVSDQGPGSPAAWALASGSGSTSTPRTTSQSNGSGEATPTTTTSAGGAGRHASNGRSNLGAGSGAGSGPPSSDDDEHRSNARGLGWPSVQADALALRKRRGIDAEKRAQPSDDERDAIQETNEAMQSGSERLSDDEEVVRDGREQDEQDMPTEERPPILDASYFGENHAAQIAEERNGARAKLTEAAQACEALPLEEGESEGDNVRRVDLTSSNGDRTTPMRHNGNGRSSRAEEKDDGEARDEAQEEEREQEQVDHAGNPSAHPELDLPPIPASFGTSRWRNPSRQGLNGTKEPLGEPVSNSWGSSMETSGFVPGSAPGSGAKDEHEEPHAQDETPQKLARFTFGGKPGINLASLDGTSSPATPHPPGGFSFPARSRVRLSHLSLGGGAARLSPSSASVTSPSIDSSGSHSGSSPMTVHSGGSSPLPSPRRNAHRRTRSAISVQARSPALSDLEARRNIGLALGSPNQDVERAEEEEKGAGAEAEVGLGAENGTVKGADAGGNGGEGREEKASLPDQRKRRSVRFSPQLDFKSDSGSGSASSGSGDEWGQELPARDSSGDEDDDVHLVQPGFRLVKIDEFRDEAEEQDEKEENREQMPAQKQIDLNDVSSAEARVQASVVSSPTSMPMPTLPGGYASPAHVRRSFDAASGPGSPLRAAHIDPPSRASRGYSRHILKPSPNRSLGTPTRDVASLGSPLGSSALKPSTASLPPLLDEPALPLAPSTPSPRAFNDPLRSPSLSPSPSARPRRIGLPRSPSSSLELSIAEEDEENTELPKSIPRPMESTPPRTLPSSTSQESLVHSRTFGGLASPLRPVQPLDGPVQRSLGSQGVGTPTKKQVTPAVDPDDSLRMTLEQLLAALKRTGNVPLSDVTSGADDGSSIVLDDKREAIVQGEVAAPNVKNEDTASPGAGGGAGAGASAANLADQALTLVAQQEAAAAERARLDEERDRDFERRLDSVRSTLALLASSFGNRLLLAGKHFRSENDENARKRRAYVVLGVLLQMVLMWIMLAAAQARAEHLFRTVYYDPFFPALYAPTPSALVSFSAARFPPLGYERVTSRAPWEVSASLGEQGWPAIILRAAWRVGAGSRTFASLEKIGNVGGYLANIPKRLLGSE